MPDITFPNTFTATTTDPSAVMENLFMPNSTPDSLDVINGWLDSDNLNSGVEIEYEHLKPGSTAQVGTTGGTATLDFFHQVLGDAALHYDGHTTADTDGDFIPIPRAARTFYLKHAYNRLVLFWHISWHTDAAWQASTGNPQTSAPAVIKLFIDGTAQEVERRINMGGVDWGPGTKVYSGLRGSHWTGHTVIRNPAQGWHTVSLRLAADNLKQVRIRNRSFSYVAL